MALLQERQAQILELLKQKGFVTVDFLCGQLFASGATIRRDLAVLENRGMLKRVRGGAIAYNGINSDLPLLLRGNTNIELKKHIGAIASTFVRDSMTLFMDSSSTTRCIVERIIDRHNLSIITNSIVIAYVLSTFSNVKVYTSGGLIKNNATMIGSAALNMVRDRYADVFFFSCAGLSAEYGTSETNEDSVEMKRAMFENSTKRILLCDHSKFDIVFSYKCFPLNRIDVLITDQKPPESFIRKLPASLRLLY